MEKITTPRVGKTKVITLGALVLLGCLSFPRPTYAILGFGDIVFEPVLETKENILDSLAYAVKTTAINSLTKSVVNWVNSGFQGSPAFVQDLQADFLKLGDTEANRFLAEFTSQSGLDNLPWRDEIAQSVLAGYFQSTSKDGFYLQNPYTLDQVSPDPRAFVEEGKYSENGGLKAWNALIFNVANNPLFFRDAVREQLNNRIGSAQETRRTELSWSNGFNGFRGNCKQSNTGTFLGGTNPNGPLSLNASVGSTPKPITGLTNPPTVLTNNDPCLGSPILTPGSLISQALNKHAVDNGLEQYIAADELNEVVGVLVGQLVNNVLGGGGLAGASKPASGSGRSYADQLGNSTSNSSPLNLSNAFLTTISKQVFEIQQYQDNWQKIGDAAAAAKAAYPASSCSAQVDSILSQAGAAVAVATSGISKLDKVRTDLTNAVGADTTTETEAVAAATAEYQALQRSGELPSISELTYAQQESIDRPASSSRGGVASLFTQMTQLTATGSCSP